MLFGCQEYFPQMRQVAYASIACAIIYVIAFAVGLGKWHWTLQLLCYLLSRFIR